MESFQNRGKERSKTLEMRLKLNVKVFKIRSAIFTCLILLNSKTVWFMTQCSEPPFTFRVELKAIEFSKHLVEEQ